MLNKKYRKALDILDEEINTALFMYTSNLGSADSVIDNKELKLSFLKNADKYHQQYLTLVVLRSRLNKEIGA